MSNSDDINSEEFKQYLKNKADEKPSTVMHGQKVLLVLLSWIVGLVTASPSPYGLRVIHLFPIGLYWLFFGQGMPPGFPLYLFLGWSVFGVLTITTLSRDDKKQFFSWWVILTIVLLLNGVGCNRAMMSLSKI